MLVMSRAVNECIIIVNDLRVEVITITPTSATLRAFRPLLGGRLTDEIETKALAINQSISPADGISISVVDLREDKVRIGVTAQRTTSVHRLEVWEAIRRQSGDL
jgi:carbon storage regulator